MSDAYREVVGKVTCSRCAAIVEQSASEYSDTGDILCNACAARGDIAATEQRAVTAMLGLGYSNLAVGFASIFFNPFLLVSLAAIANAIIVVRALSGTWYTERAKGRRIPAMICGVIGGLIGILPILIILGVLTISL